jgi:chitodextrinase
VTFSEPVHPASVTPTTISLLDTAGRPIAQADGSPILSADGVTATVVLAAQLDFSTNYRVRVLGGATGVQDLRGTDLSGTYTQASGFTTLDDEVPPLLGGAAATPAATTVDIVWTTDEPATGRVTYRRDDAVAYQRPVELGDLTTDHAIRLEGLAPATRYAFYVESEDAAGNVATSAEGGFTTTASPHAYLTIEAESARLVAPARGAQGVGAFRGGWVETPPFTSTGKATVPSGRAELSFFVPQTGTWTVWVRLFGASTSSDAWFESVDGATRRPIAPPARGSWEWVLARSYTLTAGPHVLELGGYEAQARADRVLITNDPAFVATEEADLDIVPPDPPQGLIAVPGDGRVALAWTYPSSGAARILVRYRTDGPFPAHPADGLAVALDGEARVTHTGLTNGTTYRYAAFAVDEAGNASVGATVEATPGP